MKINENILAARLVLYKKYPYISKIIFNVAIFNDDRIPSMAITKDWVLLYNEDFVSQLSFEELVTVFCHEYMHLLYQHAERRAGREHLKWNIAADLQINSNLKADGFKLPQNSLLPSKFGFADNLTTDEYYDLLSEIKNENREGTGNGSCELGSRVMSGNCGSGAGGIETEIEKEYAMKNNRKILEVEKEMIVQSIAQEVRSAGNAPGWIKRWANLKLNSVVDWRKELRATIANTVEVLKGYTQYTFTKINRRQSAYGNIIMPSLIAYQPNVCVIADTSGSMQEAEIARMIAEIEKILKTVTNRLTFVAGDTEVAVCKKITRIKEVEFVGGGGTNIMQLLKFVAEKIRPDICILLTDGYTEWSKIKPKWLKKLIVCLINSEAKTPEWTDKVIKINDTIFGIKK